MKIKIDVVRTWYWALCFKTDITTYRTKLKLDKEVGGGDLSDL